MTIITGFIQFLVGLFVDKAWEQMKLEDTTDEIGGTLDAVDLVDDPDLLDALWVPDSNAGALREGDSLA